MLWFGSYLFAVSHLIGSETTNIPDVCSGVLGFTGKIVTEQIYEVMHSQFLPVISTLKANKIQAS